jgi:hypothetical protein
MTEEYKTMTETLKHVDRVRWLLLECINDLNRRLIRHDESKFVRAEFDTFVKYTPKLKTSTYNSPEYKQFLEEMKPALAHHYKNNDHHPEFFTHGIKDMGLMELTEMLADWKAATERHENGSLVKSIAQNMKRFGYTKEIAILLGNTAVYFGWMTFDDLVNLKSDIEREE